MHYSEMNCDVTMPNPLLDIHNLTFEVDRHAILDRLDLAIDRRRSMRSLEPTARAKPRWLMSSWAARAIRLVREPFYSMAQTFFP